MSKVGFWLKGSTGKLAGTTLYKGADGEGIKGNDPFDVITCNLVVVT